MSEILPLDSPLLSSLQLLSSAHQQSFNAFRCVSAAEIAAISIFNESGGKDTLAKGNIVASRVLGCLLYVLHQQRTAITDPATDAICREIFNDVKLRTQNRDSLIYEVGAMYRDHLLRAFRKPTSESFQTSQDASPPSIDTIVEKLRRDLVSASLNFATSRNKTLARDGYRCTITRLWNSSSCREIKELADKVKATGTARGPVHVCHIVNESLMQRNVGDTGATTRDSAASFLHILQTFGMDDVAKALAQTNGVHSLANLLCLLSSVQSEFDSQGFGLSPPTRCEHVYTVHTAYEVAAGYRHWQETVTFSVFPHRYETFRDAELALPDPKLLTLHGICARVADISGAVSYFDELDWEVEELTVLTSDGSSSTAFFQSILAPYS
ncbi:hypothetical protein BDZ89DRAFT_1076079 [Hymenopellis radicata]|nr:hypothetical protein BDZ89DRAFT_1076079 [Hymenopellis radicata]